MSSTSFINALLRFTARRPGARQIYSDCGTNFRGAEAELKRAVQNWNSTKKGEERINELEWIFNPPLAHHRGGIWERMIKTTKRHLASLLGKGTTESDVLNTVMTQVEAIVNYRPLTHVSSDPRDVEALTPAKILYPGVTVMTSVNILPPTKASGDTLRFSYQRARALVDAFWKAWRSDYVSTLKNREKWNVTKIDLKKDQLVLLVDEKKKRNEWKLGRITDITGDETHGRTVEVWTGKTKIFKRDVTKVVALEMD